MIHAVFFALGLVSGPFHIVVEFESVPPHSIEITLDGEFAAEHVEDGSAKNSSAGNIPPHWRVDLDLGDELKPHELVVISRDAEGREIDRQTEWLNLHAAPAASRNATPIPVILDKDNVPADLEGWFEVDGRPAEVVDVAYPDAEIWIVRDPKAQLELERAAGLAFAGEMQSSQPPSDVLRAGPEATLHFLSQNANFVAQEKHRFQPAWEHWIELFNFEEGTEMRFVSPWGAPVSQIEQPRQIFGATRPVDTNSRGLLYQVYTTPPLTSWFRLADAVGIAGLEATVGARRRAVVLLMDDPEFPDESLYGASEVRQLLGQLGVPLFVWYMGHDDDLEPTAWDPMRIAAPSTGDAGVMPGEPGGGYLRNFEFEYFQLDQALRRQRIVWIQGRHLPSQVTLKAEAVGVRLVSSVESWPPPNDLSQIEELQIGDAP